MEGYEFNQYLRDIVFLAKKGYVTSDGINPFIRVDTDKVHDLADNVRCGKLPLTKQSKGDRR